MKKIHNIFERVYRSDRIDEFEENTNVITNINDTNNHTVKSLAESQPAVYDDRFLIKQAGVLKELVIDNGSIILKEI